MFGVTFGVLCGLVISSHRRSHFGCCRYCTVRSLRGALIEATSRKIRSPSGLHESRVESPSTITTRYIRKGGVSRVKTNAGGGRGRRFLGPLPRSALPRGSIAGEILSAEVDSMACRLLRDEHREIHPVTDQKAIHDDGPAFGVVTAAADFEPK